MKNILLVLPALVFTMQAIGQSNTTVRPDSNTTPTAKIPLDGFDQTWINGTDRRDSSVFHIPYFNPSILIDNNYTHSFNNPIDHTVVGSTALSRNDEMVVSAVNLGGDFTYGNAHGRIMTQFGERSQVVPRNDLSTYRGQYDMVDAYRYLDEAYAGYHFNKWYGINVDAGLFMSYIGLNSYYQEENWEYQASFTSDNTPWFFNGMRIQVFPSKCVKFELWLINGWQSYGMFNQLPGAGGNFTWMPTENFKILTNDYWGTDDAGLLGRHRFHSDNSLSLRYYHKPKQESGVTQMALSLTGDIGFEQGDGVNGFNNSDSATKGPAQYFLSWMVYNRVWFCHKKLAWCIGGGWMTNPGRYLILAPTGQASPFPNAASPTQAAGAFPFSENPGDKFTGWDCSTGLSWMPNQSIEFKAEWVHRQSSVLYFAGPGGVTSPSGYTVTTIPAGWTPDLVASENRIIIAFEFRL